MHPQSENLRSKITVPLMPPKNVVVDLHIKVINLQTGAILDSHIIVV